MRKILVGLIAGLLALAGLVAPPASATPLATADRPYLVQYRQPDRTVCVQINTSRTWLRDKVKNAAYQFDSRTDLRMWVSSDCSGNKIRVYAGSYGKNGKRGWTNMWVYSNGVIARADVYINLSYDATGRAGTYAIRHEIAHGVLGTKHSSSCYSLMAPSWTYSCDVYWLTSDVIKAVNYTY
jgi:hypothetical protein